LQENEIKRFADNLDNNNIVGFNIILLYKEYIIDFLNQFTYPASEKGVINAVVLEKA
jgi:shikimate dehydrogenase